jgi:molybdopterin-containing oxidoreductase family membrane subunit
MSALGLGLLASYEYLDSTVAAIKRLKKAGFRRMTVYAPYPEHHLDHAIGGRESPVRVFTLVGALTGTATGFALPIFASMDWPLVTGGKPIVSIPAFVVIAFELTILFGALATVIGLFINARLPHRQRIVVYDPEFSAGRFGIFVPVEGDDVEEVRGILEEYQPVEIRENPRRPGDG